MCPGESSLTSTSNTYIMLFQGGLMRRMLLCLLTGLLLACGTKVPVLPPPRIPPPIPPIEVGGIPNAEFTQISHYLQQTLNNTDWAGHVRPQYVEVSADRYWVQYTPTDRFVRGIHVKIVVYANNKPISSFETKVDENIAISEGKSLAECITHRLIEHLRKFS